MLRIVLEREVASGCLRAERGLWGRRRFPAPESSAQHIFGWFAIATVALGFDHESLDSADMYVEAGTDLKRCVLDRVGPPNRQAWPVSPQPRRARGSRTVNRAEIMLRWQAPIPRNGAHISTEGNIVLSAT